MRSLWGGLSTVLQGDGWNSDRDGDGDRAGGSRPRRLRPGRLGVRGRSRRERQSATATETNGPGPDTPVDDPTLSLPGLPIGGNLYSSIDGNHPDNQCTNVNWIVDSAAADLVSGIEVEVTGCPLDPVAFTEASTGCDDRRSALRRLRVHRRREGLQPRRRADTRLGHDRLVVVRASPGRVDCRQIGQRALP